MEKVPGATGVKGPAQGPNSDINQLTTGSEPATFHPRLHGPNSQALTLTQVKGPMAGNRTTNATDFFSYPKPDDLSQSAVSLEVTLQGHGVAHNDRGYGFDGNSQVPCGTRWMHRSLSLSSETAI